MDNDTRNLYERYAHMFEQGNKRYSFELFKEDATKFLEIMKGRLILDLGSGPGREAQYFYELGYKIICSDFSRTALEFCMDKGINSVLNDMENPSFKERSFDGIWAHNSIIHLPKIRIKENIGKIYHLTKSKGVIYFGIKEGNFEGYEELERYPGEKRFVALYEDDEMKSILKRKFKIVNSWKREFGEDKKEIYLNYLCIKI